ncbi:hypothetical protein FRC03_011670 [Tulasnella sp. 419]|nr:hypothetical protein FRC03_011670 [Tulasnella sp. 419]
MFHFQLASLKPTLSEMCPDLRELKLRHISTLPLETRSALPTTHLEHLALCLPPDPGADVEELKEFVEWASSLPNIQRITLLAAKDIPNELYVATWISGTANLQLVITLDQIEFVSKLDIKILRTCSFLYLALRLSRPNNTLP